MGQDDRIEDLEQLHKDYIETEINFEHYFDNIIGVTLLDLKKEKIKLRFTPQRFPYVMTKSIHSSQKIVDIDNGIIEVCVIPNKELEALILSFGCDVEVLSPDSYREYIAKKILQANQMYSGVQVDCTGKSNLCKRKQR